MNVESSTECTGDSLTIFDGEILSQNKLFGPYCGVKTESQILGRTEKWRLKMVFRSDSARAGKGFELLIKTYLSGFTRKIQTFTTETPMNNNDESGINQIISFFTNISRILVFSLIRSNDCFIQ